MIAMHIRSEHNQFTTEHINKSHKEEWQFKLMHAFTEFKYCANVCTSLIGY
jgi:hypothetical protein